MVKVDPRNYDSPREYLRDKMKAEGKTVNINSKKNVVLPDKAEIERRRNILNSSIKSSEDKYRGAGGDFNFSENNYYAQALSALDPGGYVALTPNQQEYIKKQTAEASPVISKDEAKKISDEKNSIFYEMYGFLPNQNGAVPNFKAVEDGSFAQKAQKYKELDEIALPGAGNRLRAGLNSLILNAAGSAAMMGDTLKQGFENVNTGNAMRLEIEDAVRRGDERALSDINEKYKGKLDTPVSNEGVGGKLINLSNRERQKAVYGLTPSEQFLWDTGLSTANYLGAVAISGGNAPFALGLMGAQAMSNQVYAAGESGVNSYIRQVGSGIATGAIEALTEKIPLDNVLKLAKTGKNSFKQYLGGALKQAGLEATEEGINYAAGSLANRLILEGYAEDFSVQEMLYAMAQGALSGGFIAGALGAPASIYNARAKAAYENAADAYLNLGEIDGEHTLNALILKGLEKKAGSIENNIARSLLRQREDGKEISRADIGKLYLLLDGRFTIGDAANLEGVQEGAKNSVKTADGIETEPSARVAEKKGGPVNAIEGSSDLKVSQSDTEVNNSIRKEDGKNAAGLKTGEKKGSSKKLIEKLVNAIPQMENDYVVAKLSGEEFKKSEKKLTEQAAAFFKRLGGKVTRKGFGDVILDEAGIQSDIAHGLGRAKSVTIAAVPDVIAKGRQIDYEENWKGRGFDSYVFAAPVTIDGRKSYVAAVVLQDKRNHFYLHEVVDENGNIIYLNQKASHDSGLPVSRPGVTENEKPLKEGDSASSPSYDLNVSQSDTKVNNSIRENAEENVSGDDARTPQQDSMLQGMENNDTVDNSDEAVTRDDNSDERKEETKSNEEIQRQNETNAQKSGSSFSLPENIKELSLKKAIPVLTKNNISENLSKSQRRVLAKVARALGVQITLVDSLGSTKDVTINGLYKNGHIFIAKDAKNPLFTVLAHEITHHFERTARGAYEKYQKAVIESIFSAESDIEAYAKSAGMSVSKLKSELAAEMTEKYLHDKAEISRLIGEDMGAAERLFYSIRAVFAKVRRALSDNDADMRSSLYEAEKLWRECFRAAMENPAKRNASETRAQFSISATLKSRLEAVLNGRFDSGNNEVYIGATSRFLVKGIGVKKMSLYMPANKAYSAMVSKQEARKAERYEEGVNYHNLGADKLIEILYASENPIAAFAAAEDENGKPRDNRIVLVTDIKIGGKNAVVIEEVDAIARTKGRTIRANKVITAYERGKIFEDIELSADEGRLLYLDKKRSAGALPVRKRAGGPGVNSPAAIRGAGRPGSNSPAAIRDARFFKENIEQFWANVKWKKSGKSEYSFGETGRKTAFAAAFEKAKKAKEEKADFAQEIDAWDGEAQFSISRNDIEAIQSIGRKSVNEFTSEDIRKTEAFAKRYFKEMGVKSPFFRAWFGDWRENDTTPVKVARREGAVRGKQKNNDTGWEINVSGKVFNETKSHKMANNKAARAYLQYINDIIKNAVLLDSYAVGSAKSQNTLFMHSLYAVSDIGNGPEIIKLYVEEMNDPNAENTAKRAYQLQNIENQQLNAKGSGQSLAQSISTADIKTVSDLFKAVKRRDKNFNPKKASKVVDAQGWPLIVYHGTPDKFTKFDVSELRAREGSFFFAQNRMDAEAYAGKNGTVMEVYLNMRNPVDYNDMPSEIYKLPDKRAQVEVLKKLGYDGWMADMEDGWGELSVFYPNQIKSATDNIGTFDSDNDDIQYSDSATSDLIKKIERPKLTKRERTQIQSARMAKYNTYGRDMTDVDYIFAHDMCYIIENYDMDDFSAISRLDPEKDGDIINFAMEMIDNGDEQAESVLGGRISDIRSYKKRYDSYFGSAGNSGRRTKNDRLAGNAGREQPSDRKRDVGKGAGDTRADESRSGNAVKDTEEKYSTSATSDLIKKIERPKLTKRERTQIQSARMAKYNTYGRDMTDVDYIFAHDMCYIIENYDMDDFSAISRLDPEKDGDIINDLMEGIDNGNFRDSEGFKSAFEYLRNKRRRNSNSAFTGRRRGKRENAGLAAGFGERADGERGAGKGAGDTRADESRSGNAVKDTEEKYSTSSTSDLIKKIERLEKKNRELKEQFKLTRGAKMDARSIGKVAREILNDYGSMYGKEELASSLRSLYSLMAGSKDEQITYADIQKTALDISKKVIDNALAESDASYSDYSEFKDRVKNSGINVPKELRNDEKYKALIEKNRGRLKVKNDAAGIDELYSKLSEEMPQYFSDDIKEPLSQLERISDVLDAFEPVYENPYAENLNEAYINLSHDILERFFGARMEKPTFADRQERKRNLLQAKLDEKIWKLESEIAQAEKKRNDDVLANRMADAREYGKRIESLNKRLEQARKALADERGKQKEVLLEQRRIAKENVLRAVERERQRRDRAQEKMAARFAAKEIRARERQKKSILKAKIKKHFAAMSKMLLKPTDTSHVPEELRASLAGFLNSVDLVSAKGSLKPGNTPKTVKRLIELSNAYENINRGAQITFELDPDMKDMLSELIASFAENDNINAMSLETLNTLYRVTLSIRRLIEYRNRAFKEGQAARISDLGRRVIFENKAEKEYKQTRGAEHVKKFFNFDMISAFDFFDELGGGMNELFSGVREGFDKKVENTKYAQDYIKKLTDGADIRKISGKEAEAKEFKLESGESITLTPAQVMSLYMLMKQKDSKRHMLAGGVKSAPVVVREGKLRLPKVKQAYEKVSVSENDINAITETLTDEQKRIAEGIGRFFTSVTSKWGNEVSMALYGYEKFGVENYFPIVSDKDYLSAVYGETTNSTLKEMGFTKARIEGADNPIMIEDIFDVYARQADKMGSYNAFVVPLADLQRVWNYRNGQNSVKGAVVKRLGSGAEEYMRRFITELNGGIRSEAGGEVLSKWIGRYKGARVGLNLRVIIQQPTAYFRAAAMINPVYLMRGAENFVFNRSSWNEVLKYAPIARWKDWGYFSNDTGRAMNDIIFDRKTLTEYTMAVAGAADRMTWLRIWNAVKLEVADMYNFEKGSDEYFEAVSKRFSQIIDRTQVVDSVFHRAQIMRSENALLKMATSFMSEPLKQYNIVRTAGRNMIENPTRQNKLNFISALSSVAASAVCTAMAAALIDALRDSDDWDENYEKRTYGMKWLEAFKNNLIDIIPSSLPIVRDVYSLAQGYSVERMDMSAFDDVMRAVKLWLSDSDKYTPAYKLINTAKAVGDMFGIPVSSVKRDMEALADTIIEASGSVLAEYEKDRLFYSLKGNKSRFYDLLYKAQLYKDKTAYDVIKRDMLESGAYDEDSIGDSINARVEKTKAFNEKFTRQYEKAVSGAEAMREYKDMSEQDKEAVISKIKTYTKWRARTEVKAAYIELDTDTAKEMENARKAAAEGKIKAEQYFVYKRVMSSFAADKDENGISISGSKKSKVAEFINGIDGLSDEQKFYLMFEVAGYGSKEDKMAQQRGVSFDTYVKVYS